MYQIINSHNNYILRKFHGKKTKSNVETENCRIKENYPVEGNSRSTKVVYQATITPKENMTNHNIYIGISAGEFKKKNQYTDTHSPIQN